MSIKYKVDAFIIGGFVKKNNPLKYLAGKVHY
jgi:hypothetical protein